MTHAAVQALPHDEYVRWRAYLRYRAMIRRHEADVAAMRAGR